MWTRRSLGISFAIVLIAVPAYFVIGPRGNVSPQSHIEKDRTDHVETIDVRDVERSGTVQQMEDKNEGSPSNLLRPSLGKFDDLVVPLRDRPPWEDSKVAAAYAGDPNSVYHSLIELGEAGNAVASFSLYGLLRNCSKLQKTEEELEAAIDKMYETRKTENAAAEHTSDTFNPTAVERNVRLTYARCQPIPDSAIKRREEWLVKAANDGYPKALYRYGNSMIRERPEDAHHVFARLWEMGDVAGANKISKMYETGWEGQEPDLVKAAAYGYIATQYILEDFNTIENIHGSTMFEEIKEETATVQREYLMRISAVEFDQAFDLAQELLEKNSNCCFN